MSIFTPGTEELLDPVLPREYIGPHFPERIGEPVDVAGSIGFLASPAVSLIISATLVISGWTARSARLKPSRSKGKALRAKF